MKDESEYTRTQSLTMDISSPEPVSKSESVEFSITWDEVEMRYKDSLLRLKNLMIQKGQS